MRVTVKSHALPVYKKNRIVSLLCIFESTIHVIVMRCAIKLQLIFFAKSKGKDHKRKAFQTDGMEK